MRFSVALAATLGVASAAGIQGINGYSRQESYSGQKVLTCFADEIEDKAWQKVQDVHDLDVWGSSAPHSADIRTKNVAGEKAVLEFFQNNCTVSVEDVEEEVLGWERDMLEAQQANPTTQQNQAPTTYQTYAQTVAWYQDLARVNPTLVSYTNNIGNSVEGRAMPAIVLAGPGAPSDRNFYIQCSIHAREWISGATCMWVANQLVQDYANAASPARSILSQSRIHLVPFVNPDGYAWSWTNTRLWRKNRRVQAPNSATAAGVDLNRNYDDFWGRGGSSTVPSSDTYMGPSAASEPETRNTVAYFRAVQQRGPIIGALDMHAYSQLILRPYGRGTLLSPDETRLRTLGASMAQAIQQNSGRVYQNIRSIELYVTTGSAGDWMYGDQATGGNGGFRIGAYTYELRPTGANPGFQLPAAEIAPTGREVYQSLIVWFQDLLRAPLR